MNTREQYISASFLIGGTACAIMLTNSIINQYDPYGNLHLVPGFWCLTGLSFSLLFFWVGMLLRRRCPNLRIWIQIVISCVVLFSIYKYRHYVWSFWQMIPYLYLACFGLGILLPPWKVQEKKEQSGWVELILALIAIFCYVSVVIARDRVSRDVFLPEFEDMHRLLQWLLSNTEPLLTVIGIYFVILFSFSKEGLWIGEQRWFRIAAGIIFGVIFLLSFGNAIPIRFWGFRRVYFMRFMVQPMTVYLVYVAVRHFRRKRKHPGVKWSPKDIFKL